MIQVIDAPPRSGKTYFVVNYLAKYWVHDGLYNEYVLNSNVLVISNIENLKCKHWKIDKCLKEKTHEEFFSIENFQSIMDKTGKNHIILAIDEAHKIFPAGYKKPIVYEFFAEHGHLGIDILFMTQGLSEFTRMFNPLLEFVVSATIRSKSVGRVFSYTYRTKTGQYLYTKVITKKDLIFNAYQSRTNEEQNKPKNAYIQWLVIIAVFAIGATVLFKSALAGINPKAKNKTQFAPARAVQVVGSVAPGLNGPVSAPVFRNTSAVVNPAYVIPLVNDAYVKRWRNYSVDGYVEDGVRSFYMIHGRSIDAALCRNFNRRHMSVQYFAEELEKSVVPVKAQPILEVPAVVAATSGR